MNQRMLILFENMSKMNWSNILEIKNTEQAFNKFFQVLNTEFKMACPAKNVEVQSKNLKNTLDVADILRI